ncbi:MAG: hypothetical protein ABH914_01720, partial [Candidatus Omnitrophota bacterium]
NMKIDGMISLAYSYKEFAAVNDMVLGFKNNARFNKSFNEVEIVLLERTILDTIKLEVTRFSILCH